jgi:hypothetical protein
MDIVVEVGLLVRFIEILYEHVPVFGIGRDDASSRRGIREIGNILDVRGRKSSIGDGKVFIIKSRMHIGVKSDNSLWEGRISGVAGGNMLHSGRGDDMTSLSENPVAQGTADPMRDAEPAAKAAVGSGGVICSDMVPDAVVECKINPFGDVRGFTSQDLKARAIIVVAAGATHYLRLIYQAKVPKSGRYSGSNHAALPTGLKNPNFAFHLVVLILPALLSVMDANAKTTDLLEKLGLRASMFPSEISH